MKIPFLRHKTVEAGAPAPTPDDVLAALIDTFFAPGYSLLIAVANSVLIAEIAAARTGVALLDQCAAALIVIAAARILLVWCYWRRKRDVAPERATLLRWELAYAVGAYAFAACVGALGVITLIDANDAVSQMLTYALAMGYMAGAATRNSGRRHIAIGQIMLTLFPIALAAAYRDEFAYYILSFMTLLYCLAGIEITIYNATNALRVLMTNKENSELAKRLAEQNLRFDAALNNMPQGLCMFDADGRLLVGNNRIGVLCGAASVAPSPGMSIAEITGKFVAAGVLTAQMAQEVAADLQRHIASGESGASEFSLRNGRIIGKTQTPLPGGGAVVLFEDVTERKQADARVRYLATHDMLTELPNRMLFNELLQGEVDAAQREDKQFCVLFIDLDRFKVINDTLGHAAGDALLRAASTRLKGCLRKQDIAARIGGDEFVALLRDVSSPADACAVADAVLARLDAPIMIHGQECSVTASIGVAMFPADAQDADTLLKNADAAMYLAKAEGKSSVRLFSNKIKTLTIQGLMLETSLRHALARGEFVVWYQPKREIETGVITGVEALLRWRHPELGLLLPEDFVPLAEETGLIVPIGKWALETACVDNMAWRAKGLGPLSVAVNLSLRQLFDVQLLAHIAEALKSSGMSPEWLELEITESMVMQNAGDAMAVLRAIKNTGVRLAIDDFGTGYSSLSLVKQLPLDAIKIDCSFVNDLLTDPNDRAIVEAVISLGKALNLRVVAEGVETEAQEEFLRDRGCLEMQGYLLSQPLPADEFYGFAAEYNLERLKSLAPKVRPAAKKSA